MSGLMSDITVDPDVPEPHIPEPHIPEPHIPEPQIPEPQIPDWQEPDTNVFRLVDAAPQHGPAVA